MGCRKMLKIIKAPSIYFLKNMNGTSENSFKKTLNLKS